MQAQHRQVYGLTYQGSLRCRVDGRALCALVLVFAGVSTWGSCDAKAAGRAQYGGEVRAAMLLWVDSLDPRLARSDDELLLTSLVHAGLYRQNSAGHPVPLLVEGPPRVVDEQVEWEFRLREGAMFHDGSPVDSEDVASSFQRLAAAGGGSYGGWIPRLIQIVPDTADRLRFRLRVTVPLPIESVVELLSLPYTAILPSHAESGELGAGPFVLESFSHRFETIELSAFDAFLAGRPYLDRLCLKSPSGLDAEANGFRNERLDAVRREPGESVRSERVLGPALTVTSLVPLRRDAALLIQEVNRLAAGETKHHAIANLALGGSAASATEPEAESEAFDESDVRRDSAVRIAHSKRHAEKGLDEIVFVFADLLRFKQGLGATGVEQDEATAATADLRLVVRRELSRPGFFTDIQALVDAGVDLDAVKSRAVLGDGPLPDVMSYEFTRLAEGAAPSLLSRVVSSLWVRPALRGALFDSEGRIRWGDAWWAERRRR